MARSEIIDPYHFEPTPLLIVISGPSGVGKDSVVQRMQERGYPFHFVVTATSRPPRPGEVHGVDYYFFSREAFEAMIEHGELLEHAVVYGQHKGIPRAQVQEALASGQDVVMRLDVQGAATIRRIVPEAVLIFLSASSDEELYNRLRARHTESEEELRLRIAKAREEMRHLPEFDYLVINREGHLDEAVDRIWAIIQSEHCRVHQRRITL